MSALTFQARVAPWLLECFGAAIATDQVERGDRLLEEVFELLQSGGYDPARVTALRNYVWGRDIGEPAQEVGGVMVTLAAYCFAAELDMHDAGEVELARILDPEIMEKIRAKQKSKKVGCALPIDLRPEGPAPIPEEVFDSYAVMGAMSPTQRERTGPAQVVDVLDALAKLIRANHNL